MLTRIKSFFLPFLFLALLLVVLSLPFFPLCSRQMDIASAATDSSWSTKDLKIMDGSANWSSQNFTPDLTVTSIDPTSMGQAVRLYANIYGAGFQPGATIRVEKGDCIIPTSDFYAVSDSHINCAFDIAGDQETGAYDVIVRNPDGQEARLKDGFTVTGICGMGAGMGMLMLGLTLGVLSLAGTARVRSRISNK